MTAPRRVFRIEQMAAGQFEPRSDDSSAPRHGEIMRELSALRAMLAAPPAAQIAVAGVPRPDEIQRLTSELRLGLSFINRGFQTGGRMSASHAVLVAAIREGKSEVAVAELTRHLEHSCEVLARAVTADADASPLQLPAA